MYLNLNKPKPPVILKPLQNKHSLSPLNWWLNANNLTFLVRNLKKKITLNQIMVLILCWIRYTETKHVIIIKWYSQKHHKHIKSSFFSQEDIYYLKLTYELLICEKFNLLCSNVIKHVIQLSKNCYQVKSVSTQIIVLISLEPFKNLTFWSKLIQKNLK